MTRHEVDEVTPASNIPGYLVRGQANVSLIPRSWASHGTRPQDGDWRAAAWPLGRHAVSGPCQRNVSG